MDKLVHLNKTHRVERVRTALKIVCLFVPVVHFQGNIIDLNSTKPEYVASFAPQHSDSSIYHAPTELPERAAAVAWTPVVKTEVLRVDLS